MIAFVKVIISCLDHIKIFNLVKCFRGVEERVASCEVMQTIGASFVKILSTSHGFINLAKCGFGLQVLFCPKMHVYTTNKQ